MEQVRVYTSETPLKKPGQLLRDMCRDLMQSRELSWRLAVRDINALYRQSALGILWAFILPLANTITWLFLRKTGAVSIDDTAIPYPVYVFTGTMIWAIFAESIQSPLQKVAAGKSLLTKINFPREAIILSGIYQTIFNAGIKILLLLAGMALLGYNFLDWRLLLFPLAVLSLIMAGTCIGLALTPIGILYNDIGKGIQVGMQFLMYASPVVFPMPTKSFIATIIAYNPITSLIMTTRDWLTGVPAVFLEGFIWVTAICFVLFFLFWLLFRIAMPVLIERMSA